MSLFPASGHRETLLDVYYVQCADRTIYLVVKDILVLTCQSVFQAINQGFFAQRACPGNRLPPTPVPVYVSSRRQDLRKDCWRCETIGEETLMGLYATQTWHMHIGDQTGRVIHVICADSAPRTASDLSLSRFRGGGGLMS